MRYGVMVAMVGLLAGTVSAGVTEGSTESFTNGVNGGADWGVGGADGWQSLFAQNGWNYHREYFGSIGQILSTDGGVNTKGQLVSTSHTGAADTGTLVMQAMCAWGNGDDPTQMASSKQAQWIKFPTVAGQNYMVTAWVNTVQVLAGNVWTLDSGQPKAVGTHATHWADIQIGLKNGTPDATDLDTPYTSVRSSLVNGQWVQVTTILRATGSEMSLILKMCSEDLAASGTIDLDVRWDDITVTRMQSGAVTLAPTSLTAPSGSIRPVAVSLSTGATDTRAVQVTLTSNNPAVADLIGGGGVQVLTFPQGVITPQTVNVQLGLVGSATIAVTNDGDLTNPSLPVTVETGAVTVTPTSLTAPSGAIRPVVVTISTGANDSRSIQVTLTSNNPAVADLIGGSGGVLALTFSQGADTQQTVNVQLGVLGETTIDVTNNGGLTSPSGVTTVVALLRSWVVPIHELQGGVDGPDPTTSWQMVPSGGYNDGNPPVGTYPLDGRYYWRLWDPGLVWQRVYWWFDMADIPSQPRLYTVECWVPYLGADDPKSWKQIDVMINGIDTPGGWNDAMIPRNWHNEWIQKGQLGANEVEGGWKLAGPGPNAPDGPTCDAGANGSYLWLKRGSSLHMDGSTAPGLKYGVSALRITEAFSAAPVCDPAVSEGPVDLRCVGNSDPLYTIGEGFGKGQEANVNGNALAVEGYNWPCHVNNSNILPLSPGLPYDPTHPEYATYTVQLPPTGDVSFKLRYDGFNSLKWRGDTDGSFSKYNVFTLNDVPDRDFVSGHFGRLYVLATGTVGVGGKIRVEKVYSDESSDFTETNLYDWSNNDGDADSMAVGVDGRLRSLGVDVIGFQRLDNNGLAPGGWGGGPNGGDHNGAFLFVHTIPINRSKTLQQVKLSIGDQDSFSGEVCVLAVTFGGGCNTPVFDVAGGPAGNDPDGSVDQQDFSTFQRCFTSENDPQQVFDRALCGCLDIDGDRDIDGQDLLGFEACASGPAVPAVPGCDAQP